MSPISPAAVPVLSLGIPKKDEDDDHHREPKRSKDLNEISKAITIDDNDLFEKSTFSLKRTRSMGVFDDINIHASTTPKHDFVGKLEDYPHLQESNSTPTNLKSQDLTPDNSTTTNDDDESITSEKSDEEDYGTVNPIDDSSLHYEPSRHVDYLSHDWKESDISASWRYIVLRRKDVANSARLENASWRTWTKAKYNLKTVAPESVNWLKDYDVTWLYGPLYNEATINSGFQFQKSDLKTDSSTKPILKKQSVSQMIMSRPPLISHNSKQQQHQLLHQQHQEREEHQQQQEYLESQEHQEYQDLQQEEDEEDPDNGASIYLRHHNYRHRPHSGQSDENISKTLNQQYRHVPGHLTKSNQALKQPSIKSPSSNSSSSLSSRSIAVNVKLVKHIHFNDRVEQCRALADYSSSEEENGSGSDSGSDSESDEEEAGLFLMVRSNSSASLSRMNNNNSHGLGPLKQAVQTIEYLPATTLKYEYEEHEREEGMQMKQILWLMP